MEGAFAKALQRLKTSVKGMLQKEEEKTSKFSHAFKLPKDSVVYLEEDASLSNEELAAQQLMRTDSRMRSNTIVTGNPAKLGRTARLTAALIGASVVSPEVAKGHRGPAMLYASALATHRRKICVTDSFKAKHPKLHAVLKEATELPESKWQWIATEDLQEVHAKLRRQKKHSQLWVVRTTKETVDEILPSCLQTIDDLLARTVKVRSVNN